MEKLKMHSPDLTEQNIDRIAELFPQVITETLDADGNPTRAIDFDALRQELSDHVVEGPQERYQLDWPGKRAAAFAANAPIAKSLRPVREDSVDFDTTKNLFIEGDNLDVLKLLQESYLGKVKLIYIDPPYNTGSDFVYSDDFAESAAEYLERSGQKSDAGERLVANPESNGRFNSDWLSMLYPRLRLARSLLTDDGSIFVSCDYHESGNLRSLLDEVFGRTNLVGEFIWQHSVQPKGYTDTVSVHHNTILCYRRGESFSIQPLERTAEHNRNYRNPDNDPRGPWRAGDVRNALYRPNLRYPLIAPNGNAIEPPENGWRWSQETMARKIATGEIVFNAEQTAITRKIYLDTLDGRAVESLWLGSEVGTTREAANEVKELFDGKALFDTPKPTKLMERIMWIAGVGDGDIVLDYFAGSGTTADAVIRANTADGKERHWILVQVAETLPPASEAAKAGYTDIAQLARERIRRAGKLSVAKTGQVGGSVDTGFRVARVDTTNLIDVQAPASALSQRELVGMIDSVKPDRTDEDLLFQVLLDWGLDLAEPIAVEEVGGRRVLSVADDALIACFANEVTDAVVREIAQRHPLRAVFLDAGFATDAARINADQIFREVSPETEVRTT